MGRPRCREVGGDDTALEHAEHPDRSLDYAPGPDETGWGVRGRGVGREGDRALTARAGREIGNDQLDPAEVARAGLRERGDRVDVAVGQHRVRQRAEGGRYGDFVAWLYAHVLGNEPGDSGKPRLQQRRRSVPLVEGKRERLTTGGLGVTLAFVAVEAADEPVAEPPPTQTDVAETVVSTVTQEGENVDVAPPVVVEDEVFDLAAVQEQPEFPGGEAARLEWFGRYTKYPEMEYEAGIQGKVYVQFTVGKDGSIEEAKVIRGVSSGLDKEALRAVNAMPKWAPGKMGGKPVKCRFNLPVIFKLK